MRFLHTGDWHIGKMLKGRNRLDEQAAVLTEIVDIARHERIDGLLVGGDSFDCFSPPPEAERLVYAALAECCGAGIPVVVIGGNHDHPRRLAALRELLDPLKIYVRAEPCGPDAGGVIRLRSRDGREAAHIAVLPFVQEPRIVDACRLFDPEEQWYQAYADRVAQMIEALANWFRADTVNILMAHVFADGGLVGGGERPLHLGQVYAVSPQRLPATAQYVALNHLHRPQRVPAPTWAEYSGSPLQLDFGEVAQAKRVVLVEAHPGRPVEVSSIPLTNGWKLLDVQGTLEELQARAENLRGAYLRVTLNVPAPAPGLANRVKEILPDALEVRLQYPRVEEPAITATGDDRAAEPGADGAVVSATAVDPIQRLQAYYRREHAAD
ncbi:MAG: exonuclease SbcCD subunit D, partial [Candidatus Rokuibacteriota bacterium]